MTSSSGSTPLCSPTSRNWRRQALACPESSSFSISSNKRAGGTRSRSGASARIGRALPVEREAQLRREPHRPQQRIGSSRYRVLRSPITRQHALFQIGQAAVEIHHLLGLRIEVQRIDGEIAPPCILFLLPKTLSRNTRPCSSFPPSPGSAARKVETSIVSGPSITCTSGSGADDDGAAETAASPAPGARRSRRRSPWGMPSKQVADGAADHVT